MKTFFLSLLFFGLFGNVQSQNQFRNYTYYSTSEFEELINTTWDGVTIIVRYLPNNSNIDLDAYVVWDGDNLYVIYLKNMLNNNKVAELLNHEFTHIKQMFRGDLVVLDNTKVNWKGNIYYLKDYSYYNRPWEVEALKN